jgi:hypothetical protein
MINNPNIDLNNLYEKTLAKEKKAKNRVILYTIIPLIFGLTWLIWTYNKVDELEKKAFKIEKEFVTKTERITLLESKLSEANNFMNKSVEISFMDVKHLFSNQYRTANLLSFIFRLKQQQINFTWGGRKPESGFDSPSFINYILFKEKYLTSNKLTREELRNSLEKVNNLTSGNIIFYKSGYVMLYVKDNYHKEYSIGMTPFGVLALEKDFAEIIDIRRLSSPSLD